MGKIIVGKNAKRSFETMTGFEGRKAPSKKGLSIEEQHVLAEKLLKDVPEEKWVGTLLAHGLKAVADEVNRSLAEKAAFEAEARARREAEAAEKASQEEAARLRAARLDEIMQLPDDERLAALIEEGFVAEAEALAEALAESMNGGEGEPVETETHTEPAEHEPGEENGGAETEPESETEPENEPPVEPAVEEEKKPAKGKVGRPSKK